MSEEIVSNCAHCGRSFEDQTGHGSVKGQVVCHPRIPDGPDCYRLITVYGEEIGSRLPVLALSRPTDAEMEELRRKFSAAESAESPVARARRLELRVEQLKGRITELEGKLEEMARLRDNALRQLNREDDEAPFELEELISEGIDAVISDWEGDVPLDRVIESIAKALHPEVVKLTEYQERAEAKIRGLAKERLDLLDQISTTKEHYQRRTETLEAARDRNKKLLDDVVNEVFTIADSYRPAAKDSPDYLYSLGRCEGLSHARFAVLRGLGCFDPNHEVWIPMSRVEDLSLIRFAINDPGAFTPRVRVNDDEYEGLGQWGARAVLIALREGRGDR